MSFLSPCASTSESCYSHLTHYLIRVFGVWLLFINWKNTIINVSFLFAVLSALHRLKKSPNTFIPVHMHLGPRTRSSQVSLWNLPEELILYILKGLPIRDLLSMRAVSTWSKSSPSLFVRGKHSWFICKIFYLWNSMAYNRIWFVMQVNSSFRDIIDGCSTLWNTASFQDVWPSSNNIQHFEKYVHITKTILWAWQIWKWKLHKT